MMYYILHSWNALPRPEANDFTYSINIGYTCLIPRTNHANCICFIDMYVCAWHIYIPNKYLWGRLGSYQFHWARWQQTGKAQLESEKRGEGEEGLLYLLMSIKVRGRDREMSQLMRLSQATVSGQDSSLSHGSGHATEAVTHCAGKQLF